METEDQLFSSDLIDKMLDPDVSPLFEELEVNSDEDQKVTDLLDEDIRTLEV
jgi:hypothetical protein